MKTLSKLVLGALTLGASAGTASAQEKLAAPAPAAMAAAPAVDCGPACDQGCDDGCKRGAILADIGFIYLKPHWRRNPSQVRNNNDADPDIVTYSSFDYDEEFVPRISLGAVGAAGFGARINWWGFDAEESVTTEPGSIPGNAVYTMAPLGVIDVNYTADLTTTSSLDMDVWDLEGVGVMESGNWSFLLAAGIRYAHIAQGYNTVDTAGIFGEESIQSGHNFNGAGPTLALETRRGIGQGSLYGYGNARGAVLFGEAKQSAVREGSFLISDAFAYNEEDVVIPMGEIEIGVGFRREMGAAAASAQLGLNAQVWGQVGNSSKSVVTPNAGEENWSPFLDTGRVPPVSDDTSNLGLFGITVRAGLTY